MTDGRLRAIPAGQPQGHQSRLDSHEQVVGVDGLRFMAAMLVVLYHFCFWDYVSGPPILTRAGLTMPPFGPWLHFGWVGVEVFFVISGFVIAYSAQGTSRIQFLRSRVLRLLPGAWVCATITLFVYTFILQRPFTSLLKGYFSCLIFWPFDAIDFVYWTLGVEISFYAVIFFLIWANKLASLEALMFSWGLASGVFWIICLTLQHLLPLESSVRFLVLKAEGARILQLFLVQHGCLFAVGVSFYKASTCGWTPRRAAAIALLIGCCLLELIGQNGIISRIGGINLSPLPAIVVWSLSVIAMGLTIRFNSTIASRLGPGVGVLRIGGRLTYPLYLIHDTICFAVIVLLAPVLGQFALPAAILLAIAAAMFIERYLERALRRVSDVVLFQAVTRGRARSRLDKPTITAEGQRPSPRAS